MAKGDQLQWVAVSVLVFRGDRILALQRAAASPAGPGLWEVVSGRVRSGEAPIDAALREGAEESGVQFKLDPRPLDAYSARRNETPMTIVAFRGKWTADEVTLSSEHDDYRWCTLDEFAALGPPARLVAAARAAVATEWP